MCYALSCLIAGHPSDRSAEYHSHITDWGLKAHSFGNLSKDMEVVVT